MVLIDDNSTALQIGDLMPDFSLPATDGMTVSPTTIRDPIAVMIFTCNHCPYALAYEDRIMELAKKFDQEGVQFVLINSNDAENYPEDSFEKMKERHDEKGYFFPYCYDEDQSVAKAYGALCTPHCFVFAHPVSTEKDEGRVLKYKGRVDDNWKDADAVTEHNLHDAIMALVKGEDPPMHEVNAIGCSIKWKE